MIGSYGLFSVCIGKQARALMIRRRYVDSQACLTKVPKVSLDPEVTRYACSSYQGNAGRLRRN